MYLAVMMSLLWLIGAYAGLGCVFAAAFVWRGVNRIDSAAEAAPLGFRLLILPGVAALWPLCLRKWIVAKRGEA